MGATAVTTRRVELIASRPQTLWRSPAVANFALGGLGAGFYVAAAVGAGAGASPALALASWLGPALVLAGFGAVALEAGRPLRGPRVLARVATSWMSRELWLGGAFAVLAPVGLALGQPLLRLAATLTALGLVAAQGCILREARGIPAWRAPVMPVLFLASAAASGASALVLVAVGRGERPGPRLLGATLVVLIAWVLAWWSYLTWPGGAAFDEAIRPLHAGRGALALVGLGYLAPSLALALALALPAWEGPLAVLGAASAIASQIHGKAMLILTAGRLSAITFGPLPTTRRT
jgi:phenylacetyl-CoA:acceptor oxidoreductase subunit 2